MGKLVSSGEVRDVLGKGYLDNAKAERFAAIGGRALWQLGAIGDQMTRAVGIPAGDAKVRLHQTKCNRPLNLVTMVPGSHFAYLLPCTSCHATTHAWQGL